MLVACTSSTDPDYCTTGDVMMVLFRSTSTSMVQSTGELNYLSNLVREASEWVEGYVRQPLGLAVYSESLSGYADRRLMVSRTPLVKVLRMFDATDTGSATEYCSTDYRVEDREAGFISRDAGWAWDAAEQHGRGSFALGLAPAILPGQEKRPWLVEYVAGYFSVGTTSSTDRGLTTGDENWTTGATLPSPVRRAVALKAAELYSNPMGVVSRQVGDLSVQYSGRYQGTAGLATPIEELLQPFRRIR